MRLDIYKRPENGGKFSYLAVPEGKMIPQEVINIDWQAEERGIDFDSENGDLPEFAIDEPLEQINAKGYAITSVKNLTGSAGAR